MDVAVGSENPVKVTATRRLFPDATVASVPVDSGVAEQPVGVEETIAGARTRARRALAGCDAADRGVGTGGLARGRGAVGVLTGGSLDREQALATAVGAALGPFRTDPYG